MGVSAQTFNVDGITYSVIDQKSVAVTKSTGEAYKGNIDIPTAVTYNGRDYSVTKISSFAFAEDYDNGPWLIKSVKMGDNITAIEEAAFQGCRNLESAKISRRTKYLGVNAFFGCATMTSVTLGQNLEEIRDGVFAGCLMLGQITLPDGVKSIGNEAFYACSSLTSITIPNQLTTIGNKAFASCVALSSVNFGTNVGTIGEGCFMNCTALKSISLPNDLIIISPQTFKGCSILSSIKFGNNLATISNEAFSGCKALENVVIPASVGEIGENTFADCDGTKFLTFNNSNASLRYGSGNFTTSQIERLTLGRTIQYTSNNPGAFSEKDRNVCYLKSVEITSTVSSLPKAIFKGCKVLTQLTIAEGLQEIGQNAFEECEGLTTVTLPASLTSILSNSFAKCYTLRNINIPSKVNVIELQAFYQCQGLTSVDLSNIQEIKMGAYSECTHLENVKLSERLTKIGDNAFQTCLALNSITIPAGVRTIGSGAFFEAGLKNITSLASTPPSAEDDTWDNVAYSTASVDVPSKSYDSYAQATGWKNFNNVKRVIIYSVNVTANEGGKVLVNGAETTSAEVEEKKPLTIEAVPNDDKIVKSASYTMGGKTVTFTGSTTINSVTGNVDINVVFDDKPLVPPTSIEFRQSTIMLKPDESVAMQIVYYPADAFSPITYTVIEGSDIVSVDGKTITGIKNGTATIKATTDNGLTATCKAIVDDGSIYINDLTNTSFELYQPYQCTISGLNGINPNDITWSSSDEQHFKFFNNGILVYAEETTDMWEDLTISATLPNGYTISKNLFLSIRDGNFTFPGDSEEETYVASAPLEVTYIKTDEITADITVPETTSFDGVSYTVTGARIESNFGLSSYTLTLPASIKRVNIQSNFIDQIFCLATVPPEGSVGLWSRNNIIYVPENAVQAYKASSVWKDYVIRPINNDDNGDNGEDPGELTTGSVNFDFTAPETLNPAQSPSTSNSPVCVVSGVKFTKGDITLVTTGGSTTARLWYYHNEFQCRVYNGATTTISTTNNTTAKITGVTVSGSQIEALQIDGVTLEANNYHKLNTPTNSVEIKCVTNGSSKRADISTITVSTADNLQTEIEEAGVADDNAVAVFSIQGIKVSNNLDTLKAGIYIVKRGNKTYKVFKP